MKAEHPPYWFWRLDRWKLLIALLLGLLALLLLLRGCGAPQTVAPTLTAPAPGAQLTQGRLGDVAGTAAAGARVQVFDGDRLLGETVADASGNWRLALPALAAGAHTLTARVAGPDGKFTVSSQPLALTVAAPVAAPVIAQPAPGATLAAAAPGEMTGSADPGARIRIFDGDKLLGETTAGPDGKWRFALPALAAGAHSLVARVVGPDGQTLAASQPLALTVAAGPTPVPVQPPVLTSQLAASVPNTRPAFAGTAAPGSTVRIYDGDKLLGEVKADANGQWFFVPATPLATGAHTLRLATVGPDGKEVFATPIAFSIASGAAAYDPPAIAAPAGGQVLAGSMLGGTAPPGSTVQIYDGDTLLGTAVADANGQWRFTLPANLRLGAHQFRVVALTAGGVALSTSATLGVTVGPPLVLPVTGGQ